MTVLLIIAAIVGFVFAFFLLGPNDNEPKRCPKCGLESLFSLYHAGGGPTTWLCEKCGGEFKGDAAGPM
jgi:hypothetical protein